MTRASAVSFLLLLALFGAAIFGPFHFAGMQMGENGEMTDCPFMGMVTFCRMSVTEHLKQWQTIFASKVPSRALVLMLSILFVTVAFGNAIPQLILVYDGKLKNRWYQLSRPTFASPNFLQEEFSQGILNPKIY